ncbi:hypothetical protein ACFQJC_14675 [Haloferax namakaokahaiae]|uniref:Lipoprotein n=1 Tax=Haloferax namakaokahaiae TaxID=1748331 RepID=A0ABD5ZHI1_9EURY
MQFTRREVLSLSAVGTGLAAAGCLGSEPPTASGNTPPSTEEGSAGPAKSCPSGYEPFEPWYVVESSGPLGGFDLTMDQRGLTLGDTFRCELRNTTLTQQSSGIKSKFDVQYEHEDGWRSVYGAKSGEMVAFIDVAIGHPPRSGFTWEFPFTKAGLEDIANDGIGVCGPIKSGTYRFVYWGITTEREEEENFETDYALGVPFTVLDE